MKIELTCKYCNFKKVVIVIKESYLMDSKCDKCGDKNLKKTKLDKNNPFGYDDQDRNDGGYGYDF